MKNARISYLFAAILMLAGVQHIHADDAGKLFKSKCASCHGKSGKGNSVMTKAFKVDLEDLDVTDEETLKKSDLVLNHITSEGVGKMPGYSKRLSPEEISSLTRYMRVLGGVSENKDTVSKKAKTPSSKIDIKKAKKLYKSKCASCHGKTGGGSAVMSKALKLDNSALDLADKASWTKKDKEWVRITESGFKKMPGYGKKLSTQQIKELIKYIRLLMTE